MKSTICSLVLAPALALALALSSCTTFQQHQTIAQLAVEYATIKVLQNHPERAARVIEIATYVKTHAGDATAPTVAALEQLVRAQIKWQNLDAADTILVDTLITTVRDELVARLGTQPLTPEQALVVGQVAGWIEAAASAVSKQAA